MATLKGAASGGTYKYAVRVEDRLWLDEMLYGASFEIDGQRIDPARVRVHTPPRQQRADTNLLHTPANSSPHTATGE